MAARYSDEDIQSMLEEGINPELHDRLRKAQSMVDDALQNATAFPLLHWTYDLETSALNVAKGIQPVAEDYRDAAAMVAARPGEEARTTAATLRDNSAWAFARGAEARALAASLRRLRDRYMR